jgi:tRNA threonylcarbamoyladenosine biosynthesis protein TsaB
MSFGEENIKPEGVRMILLAIETTGHFASVAIIDENGEVSEICSDQRMNHLKGLSAMIEELLSENGLSMGDIDRVAASEGPGSFTGIRIGVSTARALAQAGGVAAMGVPTLASFAYHMPAYTGAVCPVFDARRGQLYCGAFRLGEDGGPLTLIEGAARTPAELLQALKELVRSAGNLWAREIRFFGDGIEVCGDMIEALRASLPDGCSADVAPLYARFQRASSVARLARFMLRNPPRSSGGGNAEQGALYTDLLPVYMRQAEAERKLAERLKDT